MAKQKPKTKDEVTKKLIEAARIGDPHKDIKRKAIQEAPKE